MIAFSKSDATRHFAEQVARGLTRPLTWYVFWGAGARAPAPLPFQLDNAVGGGARAFSGADWPSSRYAEGYGARGPTASGSTSGQQVVLAPRTYYAVGGSAWRAA
jgi:hypothetical protein